VPLRVNLTSERDTVTLPDTSVVNAKSVIFGGYEDRYGVTQVIPVGVSVRGQLNYNVTKGVRTISTLQVGDAVFRDVPLAQDLPDEPPVNAPGQPLLQADGTQLSTALLDCVRGNADVTCAFAVTNKTDENLRVQSASSDGTSFVTRRGLVFGASGVTLGGTQGRYGVSSTVPAHRTVLSEVTFNLPAADTFIPYLQLNNTVFRNLPVTQTSGTRQLNAPGDLVDRYRVRDYAGKVEKCSVVDGGLRCDVTLTNRTDAGYNLNFDGDGAQYLAPDGRWYGARSLTAGGQNSPYSVKVPLPAQQSGAISVLFAAPAGLSRVPFMFFGGLEFENIPVR